MWFSRSTTTRLDTVSLPATTHISHLWPTHTAGSFTLVRKLRTRDESLFFDSKALDSTFRIATADNGSLEAPSIDTISLLNKKKEKVTLLYAIFVCGLVFKRLSVLALNLLRADVRFKVSLCKVLLNNVEALRTRLLNKGRPPARQQLIPPHMMVPALPASIELSPGAISLTVSSRLDHERLVESVIEG